MALPVETLATPGQMTDQALDHRTNTYAYDISQSPLRQDDFSNFVRAQEFVTFELHLAATEPESLTERQTSLRDLTLQYVESTRLSPAVCYLYAQKVVDYREKQQAAIWGPSPTAVISVTE